MILVGYTFIAIAIAGAGYLVGYRRGRDSVDSLDDKLSRWGLDQATYASRIRGSAGTPPRPIPVRNPHRRRRHGR